MLSKVASSSSRVLRKRLLTNTSYQGASTLFHSTAAQLEPETPIRRKKHVLSQESKDKVEAIFQKVLWLDMVELHHVTEIMNQRMGILLSDRERAALIKEVDRQILAEDGQSDDSGKEEAAEEEEVAATVDLKLAGFDAKSKIKVIKEVRAIAGLGLKEAKELVESAPKTIMKALQPEEAEELKAKLEAVGAEVELA